MADRRVGQHPLDVGLHDGEHGPDEQRQHGQRVDDRLPVDPVAGEGVDEHPEQPGEAGRLHARRHERHDRAGRALVDVGRPGVERHRRDLEPEADQQQREAGQQQPVLGEHVGGEERRRSWSGWCVPVAP